MKRFTLSAAILCGALFAQEPGTPWPITVNATIAVPAERWEAILGKVKSIQPGQEIRIDTDQGSEKAYNLADTERFIELSDNLAAGDRVLVLEMKEKDGPVKIVLDRGGESAQDGKSRQ